MGFHGKPAHPPPASKPTHLSASRPERKEAKERIILRSRATSIGLRPLSVNHRSSAIWPCCLPPAASRTPKKPRNNAGFRPPRPRIGQKWVRFGSPDLWTGALGVKKVPGIVSPYSRDEKTLKNTQNWKNKMFENPFLAQNRSDLGPPTSPRVGFS